jgi:hypothetical protein
MCIPLLSKYKWATRMLIVALPLGSFCQNVGIGMNTPMTRLHIGGGSDASYTAQSGFLIIGNVGLTNLVFDDNEIIARNAGVSSPLYLNSSGGNIILGASGTGNVGILTGSPSERLHIGNGNIRLDNAPLGINLNAVDRPLITRRYDVFTSGNYNGLGRWGLFMEPSRLTFGIPNIVGKGFEFSTYEANSTANPVLTIDRIGQVKRPVQGAMDLLPICVGYVWPSGADVTGSGNFTCERVSTGTFVVSINNVFFSITDFVVIVSSGRYIAEETFAQFDSDNNGKLVVRLYNDAGSLTNQDFSFIVYKTK